MIDMDMINEEIEKLENCDTSYTVCNKLAMLYIVRDHLMKNAAVGDHMTESPSRMMAVSKEI